MIDDRLPQVLARIPVEWGRDLRFSEGWDEIVAHADAEIAAIYPDYTIHQVKEKFGGLRYYCDHSGEPVVSLIIRQAEAAAAQTCEICGAQDSGIGGDAVVTTGPMPPSKYWIRTACDVCRND